MSINFLNKIYNTIKVKKFKNQHKKNKVSFGKNVYIDSNSKFEGMNTISQNCIIKNSSFGYASYVSNDVELYNTSIGKYSCIGPRVKTIIGTHPTNYVSIHPAFYSTAKQAGFSYTDKNIFIEKKYIDNEKKISIVIGNDVWIGADVKILEGVTIGDGAIIGAGAVVTKDIEPYSIVVGIPAKVIKYRFDKETIKELLTIKWWNMSQDWIVKHSQYFCNIDKFKENIKK